MCAVAVCARGGALKVCELCAVAVCARGGALKVCELRRLCVDYAGLSCSCGVTCVAKSA